MPKARPRFRELPFGAGVPAARLDVPLCTEISDEFAMHGMSHGDFHDRDVGEERGRQVAIPDLQLQGRRLVGSCASVSSEAIWRKEGQEGSIG